jgi:hypothetical protein
MGLLCTIKPKEINRFKVPRTDGRNSFTYSVEMKRLGMYPMAGFCDDWDEALSSIRSNS